jgi:CBS domain-containing protein
MKAMDVMSRNVVTVGPDATVLQAAHLMLQRRFSGLPVIDSSGALIGIVTEGDFLRRIETGTMRSRPPWTEFLLGAGRLAEEYTHAAGRLVGEVMSPDVTTVTEDTSLDTIVDLMERHRIKRLPVVRGLHVVGIVTRRDLLLALVGQSVNDRRAAGDDQTIRDHLLCELERQPWAPGAIDIEVVNGRVKLTGAILDDRQRGAIRVVAENTPGVKSIEDQIVYIEPMSGMVIPPAAA